ncbi:hypothetical protein [Clostridium saccharoperbutylacetonicum]|uniref:hypothetical protein n=1 Tax=Clostridium saccharoperbutylacetonicum TaxID=36745 RepID=UPI0039ED2A6E
MKLFLLNALLGFILICEYSTEDPKKRKFISYLRVAVVFASLGLSLGTVNL